MDCLGDALSMGRRPLDPSLVGQRVAARAGELTVGERLLASFGERDERGAPRGFIPAPAALISKGLQVTHNKQLVETSTAIIPTSIPTLRTGIRGTPEALLRPSKRSTPPSHEADCLPGARRVRGRGGHGHRPSEPPAMIPTNRRVGRAGNQEIPGGPLSAGRAMMSNARCRRTAGGRRGSLRTVA